MVRPKPIPSWQLSRPVQMRRAYAYIAEGVRGVPTRQKPSAATSQLPKVTACEACVLPRQGRSRARLHLRRRHRVPSPW